MTLNEYDNLKHLVSLLDNHSYYDEIDHFLTKKRGFRLSDSLCSHLLSHKIKHHRIPDFDIYCIGAMAKSYGMVIVIDREDDIWIGKFDEIMNREYWVANRPVKIYGK